MEKEAARMVCGPGISARQKPSSGSQTDSKSLKFNGKSMVWGASGPGGQRELAKFEPRVDLSMGRKIIEIL